MSTRRGRGISAQLENVRRRFEEWRRSRTVRTRIPEPLWAAAVEMAKEHGIHRTAKTLRIGYYGLKKRVEAEAASSTDVPSSEAGPQTNLQSRRTWAAIGHHGDKEGTE